MSAAEWGYVALSLIGACAAGLAVGHAFFKMLGTGEFGMQADDDGEGA